MQPPSPSIDEGDDDSLSSALLAQHLSGSRILREFRVLPEVDSTNSYLLREARSETEGLVVLAEHQTAGHGRQGRQWISPVRSAINCSILLRPRLSPGDRYLLTAACALAVREALAPLVTESLVIKWPNDVLLAGGKVCGVLAEAASSPRDSVMILGFGVNVHAAPKRPVVPNATCIADHARLPVTRMEVLVPILAGLDSLVADLYAGDAERVWRAWRGALHTIGREVEFCDSEGTVRGRAVDVQRDGGLVIEVPDEGLRRTIYAGDAIEPP
ncbi:MAG: biotin--[acetyl-CoA-carboxylase] ligase [Chloroflexota bacterium]|nr:biotin--[acetyl-CoA-carboxylase] ligase [Chloroflexota bacterium]